jgi:thiamine-phosphate pyrophosphorylase
MIQSQRNMNWRDQAGRLYAILDASCFSSAQLLFESAEELASAGLKVIQYRNKSADVRTILQQARELKVRIGLRTKLLMNDRSDLCLAAEFDGVHIGQDDLSPKSARKIVGLNRMLGVSTHNPEQVAEADQTSADYIAIGPVFATASKVNPDPIVGLAGVRRARELTSKPLIAIGGINRQNCVSVIDAGADSVAVISDLVRDTRKSAEEFLRILG